MFKMKKTSICASALLSALLLSGNIMTVSAISPNTDSVNTDKNLLIPLDYQRVDAIVDCSPSNQTDKDQIAMYMRDTNLQIDEKLELVRQQIAFLEPSVQCELIQETNISDVEKDMLIAECVYTLEEYNSIMNYPVSLASSSWYELPGTFTCYKQKYNNYCLPATAQNAVCYLTGSFTDQDIFAEKMDIIGGVTVANSFDKLKPCVNQYQSSRSYVQRQNTYSETVMTSSIYYDMTSYYCPTLIRIQNDGTNWLYNTNGHALCINALRSDRGEIQVADSDIGTAWDTTGLYPFYTVAATNAHSAITVYLY